jgi:large subunit ribosomal protein L1|tara:strand:- start:1018 stop:1704 length:687 start_codon:yes stop_codon:yes gene_type:complete
MSQSKRKEYIDSLEEKKYLVSEAMEFLQSAPKVKFNESIDVAINLGIDPSKSDQNMRGATILPAGSGKPCKVAVFVEGDQANAAKEAGADAVGMDDLAEELKKGEVEFDVVIATPDTMKIVSPLGKVLGPKGIMPNPKTGTVTKDVATAVKNAKAGQIRYRSDKAAIVHGRIGDISYSADQITQNLETLLDDLKRNKPPASKGVFIKKATLSSTMGAGVEIDLSSLNF